MAPDKRIWWNGTRLKGIIAACAFSSVTLHGTAQTASFNFTLFPVTVSGWVNITGNPASGVRSGTDATTGITISSIATRNWAPYTNGESAFDTGGVSGGTFFPATVMLNHWFQYNPSFADFNSAIPQLKISGLNKDSIYTLRMTGNTNTSFDVNPTQYTVIGVREYGSVDVDNNNNISRGAVFDNVFPDSTGSIFVYVNTVPGTQVADICGIQVAKGTVGTFPAVSITQPLVNAGLSEDNTVIVAATATEPGGQIAQVQFFADSTLLATSTTPPFTSSWAGADPGFHTIIVIAIDTSGSSNSASVTVLVQSVNFYWSTTGNIGNDPDSNFIGNVDSVRLEFRTKDIQRMSISPVGSLGIGTVSPSAMLHTTGSVRLAALPHDSSNSYPYVLVSDASGNLAYRDSADLGSTVGGGLSQTNGDTLALGDSIAGPGEHQFMSNRYQNLNGHWYSFGGSVNNPVSLPDVRIYNNGDLTGSTTMDRSVNTQAQNGLRYHNKTGIFELGASDRLDTMRSKVITGGWQGSGLSINSDDSNSGDPKMLNTVYLSDISHVDSSVTFINSLVELEEASITNPASLTNSLLSGFGQTVSAAVNSSTLFGQNNTINHPVNSIFTGGFLNSTADTAGYSTVVGFNNQFGGLGQLTVGQYQKNRTPFGASLGNSNVDFTSLSHTGTRGVAVSGISGYPLFVLGNSSSATGTTSTNAITVLYNGRTQINTTGYSGTLSQSAVTPKAALEVVSTNSGVLFPKLTAAQQIAIPSGDLKTGLLLYNTDAVSYQFYTGSGWQPLGFTGNLANLWQSFGNGSTIPGTNFVGTTDSERLVFRTHDAERITVMANGVVGIGTSVPQAGAKLAVKGTIYAQKIEATQTGWPDYVFDIGYRLLSLDNLGRYIHHYRHLPGMPSIATVDSAGLDLGDNQATLLQKVEELTLYLIEAQKKTATRQTEIDKLKAANSLIVEQQRQLDELKQQLTQLRDQNK